jgi:hypothetical protein
MSKRKLKDITNFREVKPVCCATCEFRYTDFVQGSQPSDDYLQEMCERRKGFILENCMYTVCDGHKFGDKSADAPLPTTELVFSPNVGYAPSGNRRL